MPEIKKEKAVFCWSGGKDSALALHLVLTEGNYEVVALLTTFNRTHKRNSMHGVRESLIDAQAAAIGLPLVKAWVELGTNREYEKVLGDRLSELRDTQGITKVIYGDIFLEDLRAYREKQLVPLSLKAVFPLWKQDTRLLVFEMIKLGFETISCCISTEWLDESFLGQPVDASFLGRLPARVDPCGENGEFHTFCHTAPIYSRSIPFVTGEKVFRSSGQKAATIEVGFLYIDLLPETSGS